MSENSMNSTEEIVLTVEMSDSISAQAAEAWAVGQRGGVDVAETDPTYHNNAKYYAEQCAGAEQAAQDAEDAAEQAESAKTAAEAARDRAEAIGAGAVQSATAAAESAQAAATAKTGAETAQSAAAGSATAAEGAAGRASQSATAAGQSASDAGTAKTAAEAARDAAAGSAAAAGQSAQAAATSAQAAEDVAESIPEDYSQLSADVTGLKSAFNANNEYYEGLTNITSYNNNAYLATTGVGKSITVTPSSGYKYSNPVLLKAGQTVHAMCAGGGGFSAIAVSPDNNISNAVCAVLTNDSSALKEYTYQAQDDCYVWISSNTLGISGFVDYGATLETFIDVAKKTQLHIEGKRFFHTESGIADVIKLTSAGVGMFNVCGKNMINPQRSTRDSGWTYNNDGTFSFSGDAYKYNKLQKIMAIEGEPLTFSFELENISGAFRANVYDDTTIHALISVATNCTENGKYVITFLPEKTETCCLEIYSASANSAVKVKNIQCEYGAIATEYETFNGQYATLTANEVYPITLFNTMNGINNIYIATNAGTTFSAEISVNLPKYAQERTPVETVFAVGTNKQYQTLKSAIDACIDPSPTNRYIIEFYGDGTEYDLAADTTAWNTEHAGNPNGMMLPDYTTLKGIGGKDKCILALRLESESNAISPLNTKASSSLEGLTIIGYNTRYVVHDDYKTSGSDLFCERFVKNCHFIGEKLVYQAAWGAGFYSGCVYHFENCIFENWGNGSGFTFHNNTHFKENAKLYFVNCRVLNPNATARGGAFSSINTNADGVINEVYLYGCQTNGIVLNETQGYGSGCLYRVSGYCNDIGNSDVVINVTDSHDYTDRIDLVGKYSS